VLFIIHLPRHVLGSSFVGFQGDPWISAHIDVLSPTMHDKIALHEAMGISISCLFYGEVAANSNSKTRPVRQFISSSCMVLTRMESSLNYRE